MTPDIVKLRDSLPTLEPIIDRLELQLVDDPTWHEPSDTSYLSDADRQNPDIAANVEAMAETNRMIAWFGRDAEGYLGLWRGPKNRSLTEAPVVRLDSEGQYSIVAATVPEYLAIAMPEDEFASTRDALTAAGFKVGFNPDAIWGALDAFDDDPNAYRNELYERARVARGLPRTDAEDEDDDDIGDDVTSAIDGITSAGEDHDTNGVPEPTDFASGSHGAMPMAAGPAGDTEFDFGDDDDEDADSEDEGADDASPLAAGADVDAGDSDAEAGDADAGTEDEDEDEDEEAAPPRAAAAKPAKAAAKQPAKKAAAKPVKKAAKSGAKASGKLAAKPAGKKAAAKPAKKAAAKPTKKAAAKPAKKAAAKSGAKAAAKKAAKPAGKKAAAKPANKKRR